MGWMYISPVLSRPVLFPHSRWWWCVKREQGRKSKILEGERGGFRKKTSRCGPAFAQTSRRADRKQQPQGPPRRWWRKKGRRERTPTGSSPPPFSGKDGPPSLSLPAYTSRKLEGKGADQKKPTESSHNESRTASCIAVGEESPAEGRKRQLLRSAKVNVRPLHQQISRRQAEPQ